MSDCHVFVDSGMTNPNSKNHSANTIKRDQNERKKSSNMLFRRMTEHGENRLK